MSLVVAGSVAIPFPPRTTHYFIGDMVDSQNSDALKGMMRRLLVEQQTAFEISLDGRLAAMENRLRTELLAEIRVEVQRQVTTSRAAGSSTTAGSATLASSAAGSARRGSVDDSAPSTHSMGQPSVPQGMMVDIAAVFVKGATDLPRTKAWLDTRIDEMLNPMGLRDSTLTSSDCIKVADTRFADAGDAAKAVEMARKKTMVGRSSGDRTCLAPSWSA